MISRRVSRWIFFVAFAALLYALHWPLLDLPFHWDELGQFVPASLDLYRDGSLVPHSTDPNIHPPGLMAILAAVWKVTGFSIVSARATMLAIASLGVFLSFLLTIRLARHTPGAPAFAAAALLILSPVFFTQSFMVLLDMPAMTFTVLALLLFLDGRYALCAWVTVVLVLLKETAITTPFVFGLWLWFAEERRKREALYFTLPVFALGAWLLVLHDATGSWTGNQEFARYNITAALEPWHIAYSILRRLYTLFIADGHWVGAIALYVGWSALKTREWKLVGWVAVAQAAVVTVFGGAVLDRYLVPVFPILYAAIAVAATVYSKRLRLISHGAMAALMVAGWYWTMPYPFPVENNLAMVDFIQLQQDAAGFLEQQMPDARVASTWPFTIAIRKPEMGYVTRRLQAVPVDAQYPSEFAKVADRVDAAVLYSRSPAPPAWLLPILARFSDARPEASAQNLQDLGFVPRLSWRQGVHWIVIYTKR